MTYFTPDGSAVPATVIALEEGNVVTMVKTKATDGYDAVQVGYKVVQERKVTKPELGHLQKAGCEPVKHLREFKVRRAFTACCSAQLLPALLPEQQLQIAESCSRAGVQRSTHSPAQAMSSYVRKVWCR